MQLPALLSMASLFAATQAAPLMEARDVNTCRAPGAHKCAVIVWAVLSPALGSNGKSPIASTVGGKGLKVVGGNCDSLIANGGLKADNPGWSADITTTYGPHLYL